MRPVRDDPALEVSLFEPGVGVEDGHCLEPCQLCICVKRIISRIMAGMKLRGKISAKVHHLHQYRLARMDITNRNRHALI